MHVFNLGDHSSITSAKRWVGGVRKWQFLQIYSTIYADVGGWVGGPKKAQKQADVILEWSLGIIHLVYDVVFSALIINNRC